MCIRDSFISPFLPYDDKKRLTERLVKELHDFGITLTEARAACTKAVAEEDAFKEDIRRQGKALISQLSREGKKGIVLAGRPYHCLLYTSFYSRAIFDKNFGGISKGLLSFRILLSQNQW